MKAKTFLLVTITLMIIAIFSLASPILAVNTDPTNLDMGLTDKVNTPGSPNASPGSTVKSNLLTNRMTQLKNRADQEITRRVTSLQKLIDLINKMRRLSADQKSSLTGQIQTTIDSLNSLKTKIDADTDFNTLKTDVRSIITSFRIYVFYLPKISILAMADRTLDLTDQMASYSGKLQTRITEAQGKGKNVSSLQTLLADMQAKIADAKREANSAITTVMPLTPDGYPANAATLKQARTMLQKAKQDLVAALQDGQKIKRGLGELEGTNTKPRPFTPAATPSGLRQRLRSE